MKQIARFFSALFKSPRIAQLEAQLVDRQTQLDAMRGWQFRELTFNPHPSKKVYL